MYSQKCELCGKDIWTTPQDEAKVREKLNGDFLCVACQCINSEENI
jgi:hypothetical protein